jgi:hypothetical protein
MNFKFYGKSLIIFSIALITPILVWFTFYSLAQNSSNSFDPNPWIQNYVSSPGQILPPSKWAHIVAHEGVLKVRQGEVLLPLNDFKPGDGNLIFLTEAQGPTFAKVLYDFIKENQLAKRVLVLAVSDGFLKDVRYYDGELALGAGQAYLIRFRALQSFALEKFLLINMSGIWLRPEIFKSSTQKLTDTFVGLHVPVFIGPIKRDQVQALPKNANYLVID